jgi:hypothetical protein
MGHLGGFWDRLRKKGNFLNSCELNAGTDTYDKVYFDDCWLEMMTTLETR